MMIAHELTAAAALFDPADEDWLRRAVKGELTFVRGGRTAVVPSVAGDGPAPELLIVPARDAAGIPTAPLVERCLIERPGLAVLVIESGSPGAAAREIHAVQRLGARVLLSPSRAEVGNAVAALCPRAPSSRRGRRTSGARARGPARRRPR